MTEGSSDLGRQIKDARGLLGMSQRELAELCGVSDNTIWNWEHGRIPKTKLSLVRRVLGLDNQDEQDARLISQFRDDELLGELTRRIAELRAALAPAPAQGPIVRPDNVRLGSAPDRPANSTKRDSKFGP